MPYTGNVYCLPKEDVMNNATADQVIYPISLLMTREVMDDPECAWFMSCQQAQQRKNLVMLWKGVCLLWEWTHDIAGHSPMVTSPKSMLLVQTWPVIAQAEGVQQYICHHRGTNSNAQWEVTLGGVITQVLMDASPLACYVRVLMTKAGCTCGNIMRLLHLRVACGW